MLNEVVHVVRDPAGPGDLIRGGRDSRGEHAQREGRVRTQLGGGHAHAQERGLRRVEPANTLSSDLPLLRL